MDSSLKHLLSLCLMALCLTACDQSTDRDWHGYVETQFAFIASPLSGKLVALSVDRGSTVKPGDVLFTLEREPQSSDLKAALADVEQARAELQDLTYGKRPSEIEEILAKIDETKAKITFERLQKKRHQLLVKRQSIHQSALDEIIQDLQVSEAMLKQFEAELTTAKLPERPDRIAVAKAHLAAVQAELQKARWWLSEKTVKAEVEAKVFDTFYQLGEQVPENRAVVSLLIPKDLKALFFVPEKQLSLLRVNQPVLIDCDSCKHPIAAHITFISPEAQFTPPVIYSQRSRAKLVYRIEAHFDDPTRIPLYPGQPIDVSLKKKISHDNA